MAHAICILCTFLLFVSHFQYFCLGRDTLRMGDWIRDVKKDEIVSAGNVFQLGFFSSSGAIGKYVGIWYSERPEVIVWVANRESPILSTGSGAFGIDTKSGNLEVSDRGITKFSTNLANSPPSPPNVTAKLNDIGNLVLTNETGATLWESFKHPTDTFLQGMEVDENLNLTSWTSDKDPAPGNFSFGPDKEAKGEYFILKSGLKPYWKSGGESAKCFVPRQSISISEALLSLSNTSNRTASKGNRDCRKLKTNCTEVFDTFYRLWLMSNGTIQYLIRDTRDKPSTWQVISSEPQPGPCGIYNACGSFGICEPYPRKLCNCFPGYEPTNEKDWKSLEFSGGCKKISSKCKRDGTTTFQSQLVTMVRSNTPIFKNSTSKDDCISTCKHNCTCQAYSFRSKNSITSSSGCWFWFDDLIDIQEGSDGDHTIFFRVDPPAPDSENQQRMRDVIIATSVIFGVALLCSIACISYRRVVAKGKDRNIKETQAPQFYDNENLMDQDDQFGEDDKKDIDVPFFELESIVAATDNFSQAHKLGQGGFGPVYKGKFPGGEEIAVKRLSSNSGQGLVEFKNEVVLIAKLQHRNLVRLLGYCIKGNEKILLYEYMPNKSLDAFIFDEKLRNQLNWATRFDIILGVARGLLYLHQDSRLKIIHRDMKASNILLDEEMNPKISDFGLARIVGRREMDSNTTRVMGTYGYMAPEYAVEGQFSVKSDAFSFGVVVLEIISGKKSTGFYESQLALSLLGYAWSLWKEGKPTKLVDETLVGACNEMEVLKCIAVGLLCVQEDPDDRPNLSKVVTMLSSETETFPNPKQPAFFTRKRFHGTTSSSSTKPETQSRNEITFSVEDGR